MTNLNIHLFIIPPNIVTIFHLRGWLIKHRVINFSLLININVLVTYSHGKFCLKNKLKLFLMILVVSLAIFRMCYENDFILLGCYLYFVFFKQSKMWMQTLFKASFLLSLHFSDLHTKHKTHVHDFIHVICIQYWKVCFWS